MTDSSNIDRPVTDPPEIEAARSIQVALIGQRIRELRRDRMTLTQLAEASSVSIGLLSRLENGVGNPSFTALSAIARALDVDVQAFFEIPPKDSVVPTNGHRITLRRDATDATVELLVPNLSSRIVGALITLPANQAAPQLAATQPGQQFEFLVQGFVEYRIENEVHQLERGDFILFDAGRPHARRNLSADEQATILSCSTQARLESFFPFS
ncbi:helix-turn-helix domain-containing protein [Mycobacterium sp. 48b]|uniref:helix-turn-helix domain-containing protein n=1 Tax=Mycobacterium sp. 48b TaxID=3400426 RepID=UPI003AAE5B16